MEKEKAERHQRIKSFTTELKALLEKYDLQMEANPLEIEIDEDSVLEFVTDSDDAVVKFWTTSIEDDFTSFTIRNIRKDEKVVICDHTDLTIDSENIIEI